MAPDADFPETEHIGMQQTGAKRNALVESARIARGNIRDIAKVKASDSTIIFLVVSVRQKPGALP
jgi:enhancing lycopene biosynthesis protein 2